MFNELAKRTLDFGPFQGIDLKQSGCLLTTQHKSRRWKEEPSMIMIDDNTRSLPEAVVMCKWTTLFTAADDPFF